MQYVASPKQLSFDVTFDNPSLDVAMSVYDDSSGSPILVQGPSAMLNVIGNSYRAKFTPSAGKSYFIFKAVYTDNTYTTLHPDYAAGTETIFCDNLRPGSGRIQGQVESNRKILGELKSTGAIIGEVKDER